MKRLLAGLSVFLSGALITYLFLSLPQFDRAPEDATSALITEAGHLAPSDRSEETRETEAEAQTETLTSEISDATGVKVQEASQTIGPTLPDGVARADPINVLDGISLRGNVEILHQLLEQEARDVAWATPLETELFDYFFSRSSELAENFGVPHIVCRQTGCEIQVIGYGQDSLENWQAATSDLDSQPWADEFVEIQLGGNPIGPDATGLVLIIMLDASGEVRQRPNEVH